MKDPNLLKDLIIGTLDLARVLLDYNVKFTYDPTQVDEVQFQCPFHGEDRKPSARLYRITKSCYCWFCKKRWDTISFIMDKERLGFIEALKFIINRYKIDTSSIPDEPDIRVKKPEVSIQEVELKRSENNIRDLRKKISFEKYRALVSAWYMIAYQADKGIDVVESLRKLDIKMKGLD